MVTPMDALVEFAPGTLVVTIAQELNQIDEWEDIPVWVSVLMGSKCYIMKLCQERAEYAEQKKVMEAEVDRMHEKQQEQQEKLSELINKVNHQARLVGEIQHNNAANQGGSVPRISLLQGQSVGSLGSMPQDSQQPPYTCRSIWNNQPRSARTTNRSKEKHQEPGLTHFLR